MADRNLPRRGPNPWLWVLAALVAIGLIWVVVEGFDEDDPEIAMDSVEEQPPAPVAGIYGGVPALGEADVPGTVDAFVVFVREAELQGEMGLGHEYTATGIDRLAEALGAIVEQYEVGDFVIEQRLDTLQARADRIRQDPQALTHARSVRAAFTAAAELMASLQQKRALDLNRAVAEVRQEAEALDPDRPLLDQKETVFAFFEQASEALQAMAGGGV